VLPHLARAARGPVRMDIPPAGYIWQLLSGWGCLCPGAGYGQGSREVVFCAQEVLHETFGFTPT
jgi:hypothetical protein